MLRSMAKMIKQAAHGLRLDVQPGTVEMFSFTGPKVVEQWHVFTDAYFGGRSQASFKYNAEEQAAEFSGRVTLEQDEDADIKRAGYCVASSKVTHIADYWDLSGCTHLVLKVKGDGRSYIANVRTDSIAGTGGDVWQVPFHTRPGDWQQVCIPLQALMLTYQGQLVKHRLEFQAHQVISVGIAASALPGSEAEAVPIPDKVPETTSSSSSTTTTTSTSTSSASTRVAAEGLERAEDSCAESSTGSSAVSQESSSSPKDAGGDEVSTIDVVSSCFPEHERFRLLIRSIKADVVV